MNNAAAAYPEVVSRIVAAARRRFGTGYRSTYLWGGHARGDVIETSDVDVGVFVRGSVPPDECQAAETEIERSMSDTRLDFAVVSAAGLSGRDAVTFHCGAVLVDGDDLRHEVPLPSRQEWIDLADEAALWWVCRNRPRPFQPIVCPFDEGDEFLGYVHRAAAGDGPFAPATKRPLTIAGRIATACVARASGRFIGDRPQAIRAYVEDVGDRWGPFLVELQDALRTRWLYRVPTAPQDRETLQRLCVQTLEFERAFVAQLAAGSRGPRTEKLWQEVVSRRDPEVTRC